jgi:hypothetical protein
VKTRKPKPPARQTKPSGAEDIYGPVQEVIEQLAIEGRIVDSGRRRWSDRSGRYEIVWVVAEHAKPH